VYCRRMNCRLVNEFVGVESGKEVIVAACVMFRVDCVRCEVEAVSFYVCVETD